MDSIAIIVTDIEGTTSSLRFVKETLFPYARRALPSFIARHGTDPTIRSLLNAVEQDGGGAMTDAQIIATLQQWMDEDRKHTALKAIQGQLWQEGYLNGDVQAPVYPDASFMLKSWHQCHLKLYVYSSGSVQAQQLFFRFSQAGDLEPLFAGWFDTRIGPKREPSSFARIRQQIGAPAQSILFISDVIAELDAAAKSGMVTALIDRPDDYRQPRLSGHSHRRYVDFYSIQL